MMEGAAGAEGRAASRGGTSTPGAVGAAADAHPTAAAADAAALPAQRLGPAVSSPYAQPGSKPFLGGYRNPASGAVFHNAATQTEAAPPAEGSKQQRRRVPPAQLASSATQTGQPRSRGTQCAADASTQCGQGWASGGAAAGRVLEPTGPYVSGEQVRARKTAAALTIQRCVRGWLARRAVAAMRAARAELAAVLAEQATAQAAAAEAGRQYDMQRRMQPRTPADFLLLYDELAMWWGQEQAKIAAAKGLTDAERQEARRVLLAKETKLLQTIDRLKAAAAPVVQAERAARQLAALAAPKRWQLPEAGGRAVEVVTPVTLRAGELVAAHQALVATDGSNIDARLAALLAAKYHAKGVDCSLTRELVGLVDREADMLNRGREPATMAGLRARLANSFLDFVRTQCCDGGASGPGSGGRGKQQYRFTQGNAAYGSAAAAAAATAPLPSRPRPALQCRPASNA